ncbi:hypothetical protein LEN26_014518 [Aphanomyces euteiches]|nr:hypothetical protein LEN26_014518 [Aphanomyces euteiches]KAH9107634.1 hypothetical protein AeMF1_017068 [Aphanomyces euteiches]
MEVGKKTHTKEQAAALAEGIKTIVDEAKSGLDKVMSKLTVSVRQAQELVGEVSAGKVSDLDTFEAWIEATRAQKGFTAKVVLDEISAFRTAIENEQALRSMCEDTTSTSKRATDVNDQRFNKRPKSRETLEPTYQAGEDCLEFPMVQEGAQSSDVISVSSGSNINSEQEGESDADFEQKEDVTERDLEGEETKLIDAEGVHRLNHIVLPMEVKTVYL